MSILLSSEIPNDYTIMHQEYLLNNISSTDHNQLEKQSIDKKSQLFMYLIYQKLLLFQINTMVC